MASTKEDIEKQKQRVMKLYGSDEPITNYMLNPPTRTDCKEFEPKEGQHLVFGLENICAVYSD